MNEYPVLLTDRLQIRILDSTDKNDLFKYRTLPVVYHYQTWKPKEIYEVERYIVENTAHLPNTRNTWMQLAICLRGGQLIDDIGIHFLEDDWHSEIGYTLSPDFQGKGYASEAVGAIFDYLFYNLLKHRVTASVDPDNTSSIKLLEKLGFRKEAHFIKSFRVEDRWADDCVYAMLEEDWR